MPAIKLNFNISAEKHHYMSHHCKSMHQNILSQKTHYIEWITWSCRLCEVSGNAELLKSFTTFLKKDSSFHVNLYFCKEHFIKRQHSGQVSRQRIFYCTGSRPRKVWKVTSKFYCPQIQLFDFDRQADFPYSEGSLTDRQKSSVAPSNFILSPHAYC